LRIGSSYNRVNWIWPKRLEERRESIKDYYTHLEADPSFEKGRLDETWDRYDKLFLNCPVISQDSPKKLERNLAERGILYLNWILSLNPFAAQLEALARTRKDVPGSTWEVVDIDVFGPGTCRPNVLASSGMRPDSFFR